MESAPSCCTFYGSAHAGSIQLYHILYPLACCAILLVNSLSLARAFQQAARRVKWQVPPQTGTYQRLVPEGCWIRDGSLGPKTQRPSNILESHHNICHENHLLFFSVSCWFRCVSLRLHFKRNPSVLQTWATFAHRGIEAGFPTCSAVPSLSTPVPGARSTTSHYQG